MTGKEIENFVRKMYEDIDEISKEYSAPLDKLLESMRFLENSGNSEYQYTITIPQCANCLNNPANGGSGICNCILGQQTIY